MAHDQATTIPLPKEERIKAEALRLGFSACGIAQAEAVEEEVYQRVEQWVSEGYHGDMSYLERNHDLRRDPRLLLPGSKSIIMVAMNYYPEQKQADDTLRFAYYAYGRDYHKVVKKRLDKLLQFITSELDPECIGRSFADSAPILERYWAERAGLGWRGKHGLLIIPRLGSYFVLGTLLVSTQLTADKPQPNRCGACSRCIDHCPTQAIIAPQTLDARRCISYLTIEQSGEIPDELASKLGNKLYGCDTCQEVCPWNRYAKPTEITDFAPRAAILSMQRENLESMIDHDFDLHFSGSPVRRAGLIGLKRTLRAILRHQQTEDKSQKA